MKIDIIGRGNVGWHLTQAFEGKADVNCVNPRTLEDLRRDADLYLISVTDDAIADVARRLAASLPTDAVVAHTSGTTGLDAIRPMFANSGVFYPLQTFTKSVSLDYSEIPVMLEASDETTGKTLSAAASMISDKVMEVSSEQRAMYHIASVFSCNFVNHLWALSAEYLAKRGLDFNALLPLIKETARKLEDKTPAEAQTGPAVRHDRLTIDRHTASLARDGENELKEIYVPLTESIMRHHPKSDKKMSGINYDLTRIRAFAFDVDGVLSPSTIPMSDSGEPMRMVNIKDGYALQLAVKAGYHIAIITGGKTESVRHRYEALGIKDIWLGASHKLEIFRNWLDSRGISPEECVYMGDDVPDLKCMHECGLPCSPADGCHEARAVARYVSRFAGGHGCVRDVMEQVMRARGDWMKDDDAFGW